MWPCVCPHARVCVIQSAQTPWARDMLIGVSNQLIAKKDREIGADSRAVPQEQSYGEGLEKTRHFQKVLETSRWGRVCSW